MIQNLSAIDTNTHEGRYLMAAIAKLTSESQSDKTPDQVLGQLAVLVDIMYKDATAIDKIVPTVELPFEEQLSRLLNKNSKENESNAPDFILGEYLQNCLLAFDKAVNWREKWYGREKRHAEFSTIS